MPADYRDDLLEFCERMFAGDITVISGKMMGHPGYKIEMNNKFFVFAFEDGLALKLPPELYEEALASNAFTPFQPGNDGKPMSTWVVWTEPEPDDYRADWNRWLGAAQQYTAAEPPNKKRRKKS